MLEYMHVIENMICSKESLRRCARWDGDVYSSNWILFRIREVRNWYLFSFRTFVWTGESLIGIYF